MHEGLMKCATSIKQKIQLNAAKIARFTLIFYNALQTELDK